ncbi:hypothetical protein [Pseudooceanicola nitratireducens]|uniref:hypothetical protein n=1 Tax=Pseudooceanicola nitratireducens TaxID=517719 RepID=UPI001C957CED|nr:hypothetical protein [Pseudooceanicola nitratireducens]MBY6156466.1 hypothetical protein [Pseudooceanicola nitratireducens]
MTKLIKNHWEQLFFGAVGLSFLAFSFYSLYNQDIAGASATFAMAFFSFIYSNIARFKRFKGLGFEAELWEGKQKEAEQLIDRLKSVVSVYTREIVMQKVMQGRFSDGAAWKDNWNLYDDLVAKHNELGQSIDFRDLKSNLDRVFLFDIVSTLYEPIRKAVSKSRQEAHSMIEKEFGSPITDLDGHSKRVSQLREIPADLRELYVMSMEGNVARDVLDWLTEAEGKLKEHFDLEIELPNEVVTELEKLSKLYQAGPIAVTDDLIEMANRN